MKTTMVGPTTRKEPRPTSADQRGHPLSTLLRNDSRRRQKDHQEDDLGLRRPPGPSAAPEGRHLVVRTERHRELDHGRGLRHLATTVVKTKMTRPRLHQGRHRTATHASSSGYDDHPTRPPNGRPGQGNAQLVAKVRFSPADQRVKKHKVTQIDAGDGQN